MTRLKRRQKRTQPWQWRLRCQKVRIPKVEIKGHGLLAKNPNVELKDPGLLVNREKEIDLAADGDLEVEDQEASVDLDRSIDLEARIDLVGKEPRVDRGLEAGIGLKVSKDLKVGRGLKVDRGPEAGRSLEAGKDLEVGAGLGASDDPEANEDQEAGKGLEVDTDPNLEVANADLEVVILVDADDQIAETDALKLVAEDQEVVLELNVLIHKDNQKRYAVICHLVMMTNQFSLLKKKEMRVKNPLKAMQMGLKITLTLLTIDQMRKVQAQIGKIS